MALDRTIALRDPQRERVLAIAGAERNDSGRRPLSEAVRDALGEESSAPVVHWLWHDPQLKGYACELPGAECELTADPAAPDAAPGMLRALMAQVRRGALWTHGDRAQGRLAAALAGLHLDRELDLLARPLTSAPAVLMPPGLLIRPFDPATDADAWLQLNAEAFVDLPDQGTLDADDLASKLTADWYDPGGFLVAERDGRLCGFHWTKVDPLETGPAGEPSGEVYVLAVASEERGTGLAPALLGSGLTHLFDRGIRRVHLFVDTANPPAAALYRRAGFERVDGDRRYVWDTRR